jgi:hypothetical protein
LGLAVRLVSRVRLDLKAPRGLLDLRDCLAFKGRLARLVPVGQEVRVVHLGQQAPKASVDLMALQVWSDPKALKG